MNLHDEIAKVAYELYEKSGRIEGRDLDNWLEAERIVMERHKVKGEGVPKKSKTFGGGSGVPKKKDKDKGKEKGSPKKGKGKGRGKD